MLAAALLVPSSPAAAQDAWTRAWTSSLWQAPPGKAIDLDNQTIRMQVRVGASGTALRIWLANDFGTMPVHFGAVTLRLADGRTMPVHFGGKTGGRIAIGAPLVSDPVRVTVAAFDVIDISVHLPGPTTLAGIHGDYGNPTRISGPGDHSGAGDWSAIATTPLRPLVAGIDVGGAAAKPVVVAFGDSITDVAGCANADALPCRWSETLGRRLKAAGKPHVVVNQGIGGNKILTPGTGPDALARFDRDVLAIPGVTHVVLLEGVNDMGTSGDTGITADELIEGYRQLVLRAHGRGIKVIAMTVLPFKGARYYRPERDDIRAKLNDWIRTADIFDGVVDLEKVVADPADPLRLRADLAHDDHLHPNAAGPRAMGEAIPLSLFD